MRRATGGLGSAGSVRAGVQIVSYMPPSTTPLGSRHLTKWDLFCCAIDLATLFIGNVKRRLIFPTDQYLVAIVVNNICDSDSKQVALGKKERFSIKFDV